MAGQNVNKPAMQTMDIAAGRPALVLRQHAFCSFLQPRSFFSPPSRIAFRRPAIARAPLASTHQASRRSSNKEAWIRASAVVASLSLPSPGEDSASRPSTDLGSKIDLKLPRRRLQLSFTCDACGARSERLINPDAYASGTVFVQCAGCEVYHKLVDNLGLIEEYDFRQETNNKADEVDLNVAE